MKKNLIRGCLIFFLAIFIEAPSQAQFVVRVRPSAPVGIRARPLAPSRRHVWADGEWVWRNNQYVYAEGRWVLPAYPGASWIPGHWKFNRRRGGWFWMPGRWRRR